MIRKMPFCVADFGLRIFVLVVCSTWVATALRAQDYTSDAARSINYRRIFVPASDMWAWPRDGEKFLPIESNDFDARVKGANRSAASVQSATITKAIYT